MGEGAPADVVIVGAGLAGMTAAYELRDLDVMVLEAEPRVGGRTLSGMHGEYWYNSGAQFVWDRRTLDLCRRLGLDVMPGGGARAGIFVRGGLAEAASPLGLLIEMPLSWRERWDFARTVWRLRRLADRVAPVDREQLDDRSLAEVMGPVLPITREILDVVTRGGAGLCADQVSGWIGLGYAIHLFGGDVGHTLRAVRGGTQAIARTIAAQLDPERLVLGARVERVSVEAGGVTVRYVRDGRAQSLRARRCVMAVPAPVVLELVPDLPPEKRAALEPIQPYAAAVSVAWLTDESGPMPWDRLLAVPVIGASFELFSNNAFFARQGAGARRPGGTFVTLSVSANRAADLTGRSDEAIRSEQLADLVRMFPSAEAVLSRARVRVERFDALPPFRKGWLRSQSGVRRPVGSVHFCGDYTAQPGTPGAVGSGHHAAAAVRQALGLAAHEGDASGVST